MAERVSALFWVFFLSLVAGSASTVLKLGLLIPWEQSPDRLYSGQTSAGAATVATETINTNSSLLPGITLEVVWRDTQCDSKVAMVAAFQLLQEENVSAYIGPPCAQPASTVAMMASIFNLPVVSWHANNEALRDKTVYTTLARTYAPASKFTQAFLSMFLFYEWNIVGAIAVSQNECVYGLDELSEVLSLNNITLSRTVLLSRSPSQYEINDALRVMQNYARIILFCTPENEDLTRDLLIQAYKLDMTQGEFVFIGGDLIINLTHAEKPWIRNDGRDDVAELAYEAYFSFTYMARTVNETYFDFVRDVRLKTSQSPFNYNMTEDQKVDYYAGFLHDAVILYALALHEVLEDGGHPRNGTEIFEAMAFRQFRGITGRVATDVVSDREPDFCIFHLQEDKYQVVSFAFNVEQLYKEHPDKVIIWPGGSITPPPAIPECGFRGCPFDIQSFTLQVLLPLFGAVILATILYIIYTKRKRDKEILRMLWIVEYEDIQIGFPAAMSNAGSKFAKLTGLSSRRKIGKESRSTVGGISSLTSLSANQNQLFAPIGIYKGSIVALKTINPKYFKLTKDLLKDLKTLRELQHDNINIFVGAVPEGDHACILMHYCARGSLMDIIQNDDITIDEMFKISFCTDVAKGMEFIHKSSIRSHGNLKSSNCVVDSRWVVKITDLGILKTDFDSEDVAEYQYYRGKLWTAPELLRMENPPPKGSQKGDVHSFGIIIHEIAYRSEPYYLNEEEPRDIVEHVKECEDPPYRPYMPIDSDIKVEIQLLMLKCWAEDPMERPDFGEIRKTVQAINKGKKAHILDNMIDMMEAYTNNLEAIVAERTEQLVNEKKKTDMLLYRMLPETVAEQLKRGQTVAAENYDAVSIFFSDIVGFTTIASNSSPMEVVNFLNDLYVCFDGIVETRDVYKVETIGDAYMVASGLPVRNGDRHSGEIASLALEMLSSSLDFRIRHMTEMPLQIRIGLHTGPCVAGVVGVAMPRYCLFGDTVNMASRMESTGKPHRIHISSSFNDSVTALDGGFDTRLRGETHIKGKGLKTTYWLVGKRGFDKKLPKWERESRDSTDSALGSIQGENFNRYSETKGLGGEGTPRTIVESTSQEADQDANLQKNANQSGQTANQNGAIVSTANSSGSRASSAKKITRKLATVNKVYPTSTTDNKVKKTTINGSMSVSEV
ncbi:atrial natriuretic peptide receptor 1-like [Ptychodera flava]|uniref:atrial natriuretic peptide receptor 1-like n=1 Tax=Ptychodera flava TaxID=63121 RepID=UPI00396A2EA2